eukprot:767300-Hanusia_phi.AAC.3
MSSKKKKKSKFTHPPKGLVQISLLHPVISLREEGKGKGELEGSEGRRRGGEGRGAGLLRGSDHCWASEGNDKGRADGGRGAGAEG